MNKTAAAIAACALTSAGLCWARAEGSFDRSLNVSGPVHLEVETDAGGITVTHGPAGSIRIHGTLKEQTGNWFSGSSGSIEERIRRLEKNPPIQQTGNSVRVGFVTDRALLRGISMRLEIVVPPDADVRARADSGGIRVDGVKGPVDVKTDSGGIEIQDIGSEVRAGADSGGIRIHRVKGSVYARADSGGIDAMEVAGPIDVQTDSGGIRMSQTTAASVRAKADSGGASLKLAPNGGYDLKVSSNSGRVTAPEMTVRGTVSKNRAEGRVRGGGNIVDIHVDSGHVEVQ